MTDRRLQMISLFCIAFLTGSAIAQPLERGADVDMERLRALESLQRKYDYLLKIPGVEGTAIRLDENDLYFVIYISRDKREIPELPDEFKSLDPRISLPAKTVSGGQFTALGAMMGTSTSNTGGCYAGSLGIAVLDPSSGQQGYITNAHVAAAEKRRLCPNGTEKNQVAPGTLDVHCGSSTPVGTLIRKKDIPVNGVDMGTVDAAFVAERQNAIDPRNACGICPSDLSVITPADALKDHIKVRKCGRDYPATTYGTVQYISARVWIHYRCGIRAMFENQIVVEDYPKEDSAKPPQFAGPGASGSVAYGETAGVLGLIFAGDGSSKTLLNPMDDVLEKLEVDIDKARHCR